MVAPFLAVGFVVLFIFSFVSLWTFFSSCGSMLLSFVYASLSSAALLGLIYGITNFLMYAVVTATFGM